MKFSQSESRVVAVGQFVSYDFGYCSFELKNKEVLVFEEINPKVLTLFDLSSDLYEGADFRITYTIIYQELGMDQIIIYRLDELTLLTNDL